MEVLVVDDNEANRKLLQGMLTELGFEVRLASSGADAIELFAEHSPDIVLMDIMMPGMSGYDASAKIKQFNPDVYTPLIFVTALKPEDAMAKAVEAGGDDFITKPINFEILQSKLNAHVRIREASEKLHLVNQQLNEHNQYMAREHELVEHIFNNALNKSFIDERFIRFHISPASAFNGDILLVGKKADGKICVLLGDFTGHGLSAAIGSLPVVKVFFTMVQKGLDISMLAEELNATIKMLLPGNMFFCASIIEMDGANKTLSYWSGGLPPMLLFDQVSGKVSEIKGQHMPLGILSRNSFESDIESIEVVDGQKLYLYTDGVTEAKNEPGEMYGRERLIAQFKVDVDDVFELLHRDHLKFVGDAEQDDDMTLIELNWDSLPLKD